MEIRYYIGVLCLLVTTSVYAKKVNDCPSIKAKVLNHYVDYQYEGSKLVGKKLKKADLVLHWNDNTDELHGVFYEYSSEQNKADTMEVTYIEDKGKKKHYTKTFKLVPESKDTLLAKGFDFEKEALPKSQRPGKQYYTFKKDGKVLCQEVMLHFSETDESPEDPADL